jgi:hypothetical protein
MDVTGLYLPFSKVWHSSVPIEWLDGKFLSKKRPEYPTSAVREVAGVFMELHMLPYRFCMIRQGFRLWFVGFLRAACSYLFRCFLQLIF